MGEDKIEGSDFVSTADFRRQCVEMNFCNGFDTAALEKTSLREVIAELRRITDHLDVWTKDRPEDCTTETFAAIHCARALLKTLGGDNG
jgi:hypothetical protein